jgi:rhomboid protease GluP
MIFLRYESFRGYLRMYPVTSGLLGMFLLVHLLDLVLPGSPLLDRGFFFQHPVADPYGLEQPWRYVTSIFLHGGLEHLLFNCFSVLVFAPPLERLLGHIRYMLFFLLAGVLGNVFSAFVHASEGNASVGASGSIYGVFGAYLYLAIFRKRAMDEASRKTIFAILIFGLIYSLISPNINIWAHIGGGVAGFAMMRAFLITSRK